MQELRVERHRTTVDLVQSRLREAIISGRFAPGQHLREAELVQELGVSRTPIREALRRLEHEKLVVNLPYRGVVVKELTVEEARSIYQVRATLEGLVARLACENRTPEMLSLLEESLRESEAALERAEPATLIQWTERFHETLYNASGNAYLTQLLREMRSHIALARLHIWSEAGVTRRVIDDHRRIYQVISVGEPNAAEAAAILHITLSWVAFRTTHGPTNEAKETL